MKGRVIYISLLWMCTLYCLKCNLINTQALKTNNPTIVRAASLVQNVLSNCYSDISSVPFNQFLPSLQMCLQNGSLLALDEMQQSEIFELSDGVQLVDSNAARFRTSQNSSDITNNRILNWKKEILLKLNKLLHSHNLKIHLKSASHLTSEGENGEEARRRHHGHVMPLIIFATIALGMVMIPMGFQFLAVLGGKALLLAKMALLLSSIQGLKKIASSNVSYGLYQTPERCK